MEEHIDSGSRCNWGHPLMLVAEGYAYCHDEPATWWWPWRLTPPHASREQWWAAIDIVGRAAQEAGRQAIGIEIEERWCEAAAKRLDDFVPGPREQQQMFAGVEG